LFEVLSGVHVVEPEVPKKISEVAFESVNVFVFVKLIATTVDKQPGVAGDIKIEDNHAKPDINESGSSHPDLFPLGLIKDDRNQVAQGHHRNTKLDTIDLKSVSINSRQEKGNRTGGNASHVNNQIVTIENIGQADEVIQSEVQRKSGQESDQAVDKENKSSELSNIFAKEHESHLDRSPNNEDQNVNVIEEPQSVVQLGHIQILKNQHTNGSGEDQVDHEDKGHLRQKYIL